MKLLSGQITEVFADDEFRIARVRVQGALRTVSLAFTPEVRPGDRVLVCDGVALSKVFEESPTTAEASNHVSGDSRKNH